jgi:heptosyltransferase-2
MSKASKDKDSPGDIPSGTPSEPEGPILLRGLNWLGDAVISLPALLSIRVSFKGDFYVLSRGAGAELYKLSPGPREVIADDKKLLSRLSLIKSLKKRKFSKAILLQNAFDAGLVAYFSKIPQRVGYDRHGRGVFLTNPIELTPIDLFSHEIFYYLKVVRESGIRPFFSLPRLPVPDRLPPEEARLLSSIVHPKGDGDGDGFADRYREGDGDDPEGLFRELIGEGKREGPEREGFKDFIMRKDSGKKDEEEEGSRPFLLVLAPGASFGSAKRWPARNFAAAAKNILREIPGTAVILGGTSEKGAADEVESYLKGGPRTINLAGKTTLSGAAWIISKASMVICNDSGIMHLAGALGVPLVVPFGPTNPLTTGPLGADYRILRKGSFCSPCLKRNCPFKKRICFEGIGGDDAADAAFKLISLRETRRGLRALREAPRREGAGAKKAGPGPGGPGPGRKEPAIPALFVTRYIEDSFSLSAKLKMPLIFILPDSLKSNSSLPFDLVKKSSEDSNAISPWTPWKTVIKPDATLYGHSVFFRGGDSPRRFYRKLQTDWNIDLTSSFWLGSDMETLSPAQLFDGRIAFFPEKPQSPPGTKELLSLELLPGLVAPDFQGALDWAGALQ